MLNQKSDIEHWLCSLILLLFRQPVIWAKIITLVTEKKGRETVYLAIKCYTYKWSQSRYRIPFVWLDTKHRHCFYRTARWKLVVSSANPHMSGSAILMSSCRTFLSEVNARRACCSMVSCSGFFVQGVSCRVTRFVYAFDSASVFISLPVWKFTDTPREAQTTVTWKNSRNSTNIPGNLGVLGWQYTRETEVWETGEIQGQGQTV